MNKFFKILAAATMLLGVVWGQKIEITKPYKYTASRDDSQNSAKAKAINEAQADLLQELGVLVESNRKMTTVASGNDLKEEYIEEIKAYTSGKVQTTIVEGTEKWAENVFSATFTMVVDTADLYKYLDDIVKSKQKAAADSLERIRKKAEMEQEMENRRLLQVEQARTDSLAKEKNVSKFRLAVRTAQDLLEQEQKREKPLSIEKDKKERELQNAQRLKDDAEKTFNDSKNKDDGSPHWERKVASDRKFLQEAQDNYSNKLSEYRAAEKEYNDANRKVETARRNLQTAQDNLNKELGIKTSSPAYKTTPDAAVQKTSVKNGCFVFSIRPELATSTSVTSAGVGVELGKIGKKGFYFTGEINGGGIYWGGGLNLGACINKDGLVKNVLGASLGYRNSLYIVDIENKNGKKLAESEKGDNLSIAGLFWKLVIGKEKNFDITNKVLFGYKKNPTDYDIKTDSVIYKEGINTTYILGIGYTLTRKKR